MYNPLSSHDTERILTKLGGDRERVQLAFTLQFSLPGAPGIYYGDEIGLPGDKDPDCRRAFPWDRDLWDCSIRDWVKVLVAARKGSSAMRRGDLKFIWIDDKSSTFAMERRTEDQQVLVLINASPVSKEITLDTDLIGWSSGQPYRDLLTDDIFPIVDGRITTKLKPMHGAWLCNSMSTFA
jgi:glycosidase